MSIDFWKFIANKAKYLNNRILVFMWAFIFADWFGLKEKVLAMHELNEVWWMCGHLGVLAYWIIWVILFIVATTIIGRYKRRQVDTEMERMRREVQEELARREQEARRGWSA